MYPAATNKSTKPHEIVTRNSMDENARLSNYKLGRGETEIDSFKSGIFDLLFGEEPNNPRHILRTMAVPQFGGEISHLRSLKTNLCSSLPVELYLFIGAPPRTNELV